MSILLDMIRLSEKAQNLALQGWKLYKEGRLTEALKTFQDGIRLDAKNDLAHVQYK